MRSRVGLTASGLNQQHERFASPVVDRRELPGGGFILTSPQQLGPYPNNVIDYLAKWATEKPNQIYLAERTNDAQWRTVTYREALAKVRSLGQFFLDQGASPDRPVVAITENSISHAIVHLGAMYSGVPFAAISTSYSAIADAFSKLKLCIETLKPRVIFVEELGKKRQAIHQLDLADSIILTAGESVDDAIGLEAAFRTEPMSVDRICASIKPDDVAKYIFTSGSTGVPKAVINTHRMISANQQQLVQIYPLLNDRPPVLVDWLPWSHTFGGNQTFFLALRHGGTMYIDSGKPIEAAFSRTLCNLKEVQPTVYFNVPKAFEMLVPHLERDKAFCRHFFGELDLIYYAGASLPQRIWTSLEMLSLDVRGERIPIVTAWGTTETAPLATGVHYESARADNIGLPVPGCEIKFAVCDDRYELRVKGANVTPGYKGNPEATKNAFDEDGFFKTGDAASLLDESDPSKGIVFGGRVAEDFKLTTGTWVSVGSVKVNTLNSLLPLATHVVVAGHDRDAIGLLLFVDELVVRRLSNQGPADGPTDLNNPGVRSFVRERLKLYNKNAQGSSASIVRVLLLATAPSIGGNEITDKGYINQRAVLTNRAAEVERLFSESADAIVI